MAALRLRVGWAGRFSGYVQVGVSGTVAPATNSVGYPVIGDNIAVPSYSGPYDTISADKYGPKDFELTRGRDDPYSNMLSGQLVVNLMDVYPGRYNRKNTSSPLFGQVKPMRPCCLDLTLDGGATYLQLFNGWLDEQESQVDWGNGTAKLNFKDLFLWLDRNQTLSIASTGPIYVGAALNLVLDAIGWPSSLRRIMTGSLLPDFSIVPGTSVLQQIADIMVVDGGALFHSRDNYATYFDKYAFANKVSVATLTPDSNAIVGVNLASVQNAATATWNITGNQQIAEDASSQKEYGPNSWPDVSSDYFLSDQDALDFCETRVLIGKQPVDNAWSLKFSEATPGALSVLSQLEFLDRVTVPAFGSTLDYHVQKIVHRGQENNWLESDLVLADRPLQGLPFRVGVSSIAAAAQPNTGYDVIWR